MSVPLTPPAPDGRRRLVVAGLVPAAVLALAFGLLAGLQATAAAPDTSAAAVDPEPRTNFSRQAGDLRVNAIVAEEVRPGAPLQHAIRYTNTTDAAVSDIVIAIELSEGQTWDGSYDADPAVGDFSQDELSAQWRLASLAPGASGTIELETTVNERPEPSPEQGILLVGSSVQISSSQADVTGGEDNAVARVVGPLLVLRKQVSQRDIIPGRRLVYTLTLRNLARRDAIPATGVTISDTLPEHTTFEDISPRGQLDAEKGWLLWSLTEPLVPDSSEIVTFSAHVTDVLGPVTNITNDRDDYVATANELRVNDVRGRDDVRTNMRSPIDKMVSEGRDIFPGQPVTYTWTVHNPKPFPLTGVVVTDSLPANKGPGAETRPPDFRFVAPVEGAPAPAVDGRTLVWRDISVPAWGATSVSYVAETDRRTYIGSNRRDEIYESELDASHPDVDLPKISGVARVVVNAAVWLEKSVQPGLIQSGEQISYTITMRNNSSLPVRSIRLTDTMEGAGFRFTGMIDGPSPEAAFDSNPVVWTGLQLDPSEVQQLTFRARAVGVPLQQYANGLDASSPDFIIPSRRRLAAVRIDSPFRIQKDVAPERAYIGDEVRYDIGLTNVSTATYTLERVEDLLPNGFFDADTGADKTIIDIDPPEGIPPDGTWQDGFSAFLSGNLDCTNLPKQARNRRGNVRLFFTEFPGVFFSNASDLAPLDILPHARTFVTPTRRTVQVENELTYRVHIKNDASVDGENGRIRLVLPEGFSYLSSVSGPEPEALGAREIEWSNTQLPANDDWSAEIRARARDQLGHYTANVAAEANGTFCIQNKDRAGAVDIREDVVLLEVFARDETAAPGEAVNVDLQIRNFDAYPFTLPVVSATVPSGFHFVQMLDGPEPTVSEGKKVMWHEATVPPNAVMRWRFQLAAAPLFGSYTVRAGAESPETVIRPAESAPINVIPQLQMSKLADRPQVTAGTSVRYTISLLNAAPRAFDRITLTDTLPTGFTFFQMHTGPDPFTLGPNRDQPVWENISIRGDGATMQLVFEALVDENVADGTYYNRVTGYSPRVFVPGTDDTAPVTVVGGGSGVPTPSPTVATPDATATASATALPPGTPSSTPAGPSATPTRRPTAEPTPSDFVPVASVYLPWMASDY